MISTLDFICIRVKDQIPEVLLRRRTNPNEPAFDQFALIGGMVWEESRDGSNVYDKTLEDAAKRILKMKVPHSFSPSYTEQLLDVGNETRDSRGWSKTTPYLCLFQTSETADFNTDEDFKWVPLLGVLNKNIKLPFDHADLIKNAYDTLVTKSRYSSVLFYLLEDDFVVKDVIDCFASFDYRVSKQTIMKRWVDKKLMIPTGNKRRNENGGKPAFVYNLSNNELNYFEFSLAMK